MRILITGYTGFVGKNWLEYCCERSLSYEHMVFSRNKLYGSENTYKEYFANIDGVLHLAGKAHDLKNASAPQEYYEVNTHLTKRLYDSFLQSNAKFFIFLSSIKALADKYDGIMTEEMHPNPLTDYGKSKLYAESYIFSKPIPAGKFVYILRPCMIHGPGNKGNLNLLYKVVSKGIPYPFAAFQNVRSFLSVENLCFTIDQLLSRDDIASGIYHIADDEPISTTDIVKIIANSLKKKGKLLNVSPKLIKFLARVGDKTYLPINTERLQKITDTYVVSNQKLITALQIPLPIKARDGLVKTIESFKDVS